MNTRNGLCYAVLTWSVTFTLLMFCTRYVSRMTWDEVIAIGFAAFPAGIAAWTAMEVRARYPLHWSGTVAVAALAFAGGFLPKVVQPYYYENGVREIFMVVSWAISAAVIIPMRNGGGLLTRERSEKVKDLFWPHKQRANGYGFQLAALVVFGLLSGFSFEQYAHHQRFDWSRYDDFVYFMLGVLFLLAAICCFRRVVLAFQSRSEASCPACGKPLARSCGACRGCGEGGQECR